MELLKDPKRLAAAQTFLMVPLWDDRPDEKRIKGKCEHCGYAVAWQAESSEVMEALGTHLLCPLCTRLLLSTYGGAIESLGKLDGRTLTR